MHPFFTNIGAYLKSFMTVLNNAATAAVNGAAINLIGPGYQYRSGQIGLYIGAATGSPSAISVTAQVQQSADGSTGWTNYTDPQGNGALTLTTASTQATMNVNLQGALQYVRVAVTPTFTGGTSPAIPVNSWVVLGGTSEHPAI
jgi:hypothetical protein